MASLETDVLVIGGGATGAGVAWDAPCAASTSSSSTAPTSPRARAAASTGCCTRAAATWSRTASRPRSASHENAILRRIVPDCIEDTGGLFVVTPDDDPAYGDEFLEGCMKPSCRSRRSAVGEALQLEPRLNPGIKRAFTVPDASIDAWKTVWSLARGASDARRPHPHLPPRDRPARRRRRRDRRARAQRAAPARSSTSRPASRSTRRARGRRRSCTWPGSRASA